MPSGPVGFERHAGLIKEPPPHRTQVRDIAASRKEWVAAITHGLVHCNKPPEPPLHVVRYRASNDGRALRLKVLGVAQVAEDLQPALGVAPLHELAHRLSKEESDI